MCIFISIGCLFARVYSARTEYSKLVIAQEICPVQLKLTARDFSCVCCYCLIGRLQVWYLKHLHLPH